MLSRNESLTFCCAHSVQTSFCSCSDNFSAFVKNFRWTKQKLQRRHDEKRPIQVHGKRRDREWAWCILIFVSFWPFLEWIFICLKNCTFFSFVKKQKTQQGCRRSMFRQSLNWAFFAWHDTTKKRPVKANKSFLFWKCFFQSGESVNNGIHNLNMCTTAAHNAKAYFSKVVKRMSVITCADYTCLSPGKTFCVFPASHRKSVCDNPVEDAQNFRFHYKSPRELSKEFGYAWMSCRYLACLEIPAV